MRRFLRLLLIVAAPVLFAGVGHAGDPLFEVDDFNRRTPVLSETLEVRDIPGTDKILTTIMIVPNDHQICVCGVVTPLVRCACETPKMGICLEWES